MKQGLSDILKNIFLLQGSEIYVFKNLKTLSYVEGYFNVTQDNSEVVLLEDPQVLDSLYIDLSIGEYRKRVTYRKAINFILETACDIANSSNRNLLGIRNKKEIVDENFLYSEQGYIKFHKYIKNTDIPKLEIQIKPISNKLHEVCYRYMNLDVIPKPTPFWDSFLSQMSIDDQKVFKAFVYSIFYSEAKVKSMLYIYDVKGSRGKSTFIGELGKFITNGGKNPNFVRTYEIDKGQFNLSGLDKAILIQIPDTDNKNIHKDEILKKITGGDTIRIDEKYASPREVYIDGKIIIHSNHAPYTSNIESEEERLLLVRIENQQDISKLTDYFYYNEKGMVCYKKTDTEIRKRILDEVYDFVLSCKKDFEELTEGSNRLSNTRKREINKSPMDTFFERYFDCYVDKIENIKRNDQEMLKSQNYYTNPKTIKSCVDDFNKNEIAPLQLQHIQTRLSPIKMMSYKNNTQQTIYIGIKLKPQFAIGQNGNLIDNTTLKITETLNAQNLLQ